MSTVRFVGGGVWVLVGEPGEVLLQALDHLRPIPLDPDVQAVDAELDTVRCPHGVRLRRAMRCSAQLLIAKLEADRLLGEGCEQPDVGGGFRMALRQAWSAHAPSASASHRGGARVRERLARESAWGDHPVTSAGRFHRVSVK